MASAEMFVVEDSRLAREGGPIETLDDGFGQYGTELGGGVLGLREDIFESASCGVDTG